MSSLVIMGREQWVVSSFRENRRADALGALSKPSDTANASVCSTIADISKTCRPHAAETPNRPSHCCTARSQQGFGYSGTIARWPLDDPMIPTAIASWFHEASCSFGSLSLSRRIEPFSRRIERMHRDQCSSCSERLWMRGNRLGARGERLRGYRGLWAPPCQP